MRQQRGRRVGLPGLGAVGPRQVADRQQLDPELARQLGDLPVMTLGVVAELGHAAENREPPSSGSALGQMPQRGLHRRRIGVVGVVDDEAAAGKRELLAAPFRELHRGGALLEPVERQVHRLVRGQGRERVLRLVARREREADSPLAEGDVGAVLPQLDVDRRHAEDLDVGPQVRLQLDRDRDDRDPVGRQRVDELRLRACDAVDRAHELEVDGPDGTDDADVRPDDLAEVGDLAEAAHAHLDDADLRLRLEPASVSGTPSSAL